MEDGDDDDRRVVRPTGPVREIRREAQFADRFTYFWKSLPLGDVDSNGVDGLLRAEDVPDTWRPAEISNCSTARSRADPPSQATTRNSSSRVIWRSCTSGMLETMRSSGFLERPSLMDLMAKSPNALLTARDPEVLVSTCARDYKRART